MSADGPGFAVGLSPWSDTYGEGGEVSSEISESSADNKMAPSLTSMSVHT